MDGLRRFQYDWAEKSCCYKYYFNLTLGSHRSNDITWCYLKSTKEQVHDCYIGVMFKPLPVARPRSPIVKPQPRYKFKGNLKLMI